MATGEGFSSELHIARTIDNAHSIRTLECGGLTPLWSFLLAWQARREERKEKRKKRKTRKKRKKAVSSHRTPKGKKG
jgi:hypothetical protein